MRAGTEQVVRQLKALADPIRMRLLALCSLAECSVTELTGVTALSQPRVSQHLKSLCATGLLERFRDGHFVYYRVPLGGAGAEQRRRLLAMLPDDEPQFDADLARLRAIRAPGEETARAFTRVDRSLFRALLELTVARPLGDLLDIGCGRGDILKLLASRSTSAVGVDVDSDQRRLARAQLLLAGTPNCTLRHGDMYALPFDDGGFDTIVLDDVLVDADEPLAVLAEARRLLKPNGRVVVLVATSGHDVAALRSQLADWAAASALRLAEPRQVPSRAPSWLLAVASPADGVSRTVAAA